MIVIGAEIRTDASDLNRDLRRNARNIERRLGGAFRSVGRIASASLRGATFLAGSVGRGLTGLARNLTNLRTLVGGAVAALGIDRLIRSGSQLEIQQAALARQLGVSRRQVGRYISAVNNASAGLLDFSRAAELANQSAILDLDPSGVERLTRAFTLLAVARGRTDNVSRDLEELFNSIARAEPPKRFGIFVDPRELQGLTLAERQTVVLQRAIAELERRSARLGVTGREVFFSYTGIGGNIKDILVGTGQWLSRSEQVGKVVERINKITGGIAEGLRGPNAGDVGRALIVSAAEAVPTLIKAVGLGVMRVILEGAAIATDAIGKIDWPELGSRIGGGLLKAVAEAAPLLAKVVGIQLDKIDEMTRGGSNIFEAGAAALRETAQSVNPLNPLAEFGKRLEERFGVHGRTTQGRFNRAGLEQIDLENLSLSEIDRRRKEITDPSILRKRVALFEQSLRSDPETNRTQTDEEIIDLAFDLARQSLEADRAIARLGLPGSGVKRSELARRDRQVAGDFDIETDTLTPLEKKQNQKNARVKREKLLSEALTDEERAAIDAFNRQARPSRPVMSNPFDAARSQLGLRSDASLMSTVLAAFGIPTNERHQGDQPPEGGLGMDSGQAAADADAGNENEGDGGEVSEIDQRRAQQRQSIIDRRETERQRIRERLGLQTLAQTQADFPEETVEDARRAMAESERQRRQNAGEPFDEQQAEVDRLARRLDSLQRLQQAGVEVDEQVTALTESIRASLERLGKATDSVTAAQIKIEELSQEVDRFVGTLQ